MIKEIAEHSVDLGLLKRDSKVLDLGCRHFTFTNSILEYVDEVYCVDPDQSVITTDTRIHLINVAIGAENKLTRYVRFGNGTGNYIETNEPRPADCMVDYVPVWTLEKISNYFGVYDWDLIKCDIEKSEIDLIRSLVRPPAKQLSIEFHKHCGSTEEEIQECFTKLKMWYELSVCDYIKKHGLSENYWDTCWLLK